MIPEVRAKIKHIQLRSISEGYKKTKVGVIPDVWHCYQIHECLSICNHERKPISEDVRKTIPGPYPYYGPTQAQGYIATYESEGPAVLIGEDGDHFLKYKDREMTMYVDGKYTVNNHAHVLRGTELCETKWFYYAYQHKSLFDAITRQGAGRYKLTKEALIKLPLQCPPIEEQRKIISILNTQDKVIELKEKHLAEKHRQKKYLMQQLLTGKKRLPGFSGEWSMQPLSQLSKAITKKTADEQYEVLSISAGIGFVNQSEKFGKQIAGEQYKNYIVISRGDFSYNKGNSKKYPQGCIYPLESRECAAVPNVFISFTMQKSKCFWKYYKYLFENGWLNKQLYRLINSGVRNDGLLNLSDKEVFNCFVPVPPFNEQTAIAEILSTADSEIDLICQDIEQEKQKKKALMQLLLTGIVRVKV